MQIFFDLGKRGLILLIGERKFELVFFFFLRFLQSLSRSLDGKAFRVEQPLDFEQELDVRRAALRAAYSHDPVYSCCRLSQERPVSELDQVDSVELPASREGLPPQYRMRADRHYVEQLTTSSGQPIRMISVADLDVTPLGDVPMRSLLESIRRHGILQPLLVRPLHDGSY